MDTNAFQKILELLAKDTKEVNKVDALDGLKKSILESAHPALKADLAVDFAIEKLTRMYVSDQRAQPAAEARPLGGHVALPVVQPAAPAVEGQQQPAPQAQPPPQIEMNFLTGIYSDAFYLSEAEIFTLMLNHPTVQYLRCGNGTFAAFTDVDDALSAMERTTRRLPANMSYFPMNLIDDWTPELQRALLNMVRRNNPFIRVIRDLLTAVNDPFYVRMAGFLNAAILTMTDSETLVGYAMLSAGKRVLLANEVDVQMFKFITCFLSMVPQRPAEWVTL